MNGRTAGRPGTRIGARGRDIPRSMREGTLGGSPPGRCAPILIAGLLAVLLVAACSSAGASGGGADAGYCESNGYSSPTGSSCPKGTCLASGTPVSCCGSLCSTCESKGLVPYDAGGMCPAGLCPSADATGTLQCCDTCGPLNADAGSAGAADSAATEAASEAGASDALAD
jgi:hypothetical protein